MTNVQKIIDKPTQDKAVEPGEFLTTPVDPLSLDFQKWYQQQDAQLSLFFLTNSATQNTKADALLLPNNGEETQGESSTSPISTAIVSSTANGFYAYRNSRSSLDWNTCGQAAIATMLDFHGRDPFGLPRTVPGSDGKYHWESGEIIDRLKAAGWGPDVVFGWGTTGSRIAEALRFYGLNQAYVDHAGLFSAGWEQLWDRLKYFLRVLQTPVPVLVDMGALGGNAFTAHWPVAYKIDSNDNIYLGNCYPYMVSKSTFLRAWSCSFLPLGFNFCAVYYWRAWG